MVEMKKTRVGLLVAMQKLCCEAEESVNHGNNERVEHTEDDKAHEANHNENSANVEIHGDGDGEAKKVI